MRPLIKAFPTLRTHCKWREASRTSLSNGFGLSSASASVHCINGLHLSSEVTHMLCVCVWPSIDTRGSQPEVILGPFSLDFQYVYIEAAFRREKVWWTDGLEMTDLRHKPIRYCYIPLRPEYPKKRKEEEWRKKNVSIKPYNIYVQYSYCMKGRREKVFHKLPISTFWPFVNVGNGGKKFLFSRPQL